MNVSSRRERQKVYVGVGWGGGRVLSGPLPEECH